MGDHAVAGVKDFSFKYVCLYVKAVWAKPFADICSREESFHILESRPYLTSQVIRTVKRNP